MIQAQLRLFFLLFGLLLGLNGFSNTIGVSIFSQNLEGTHVCPKESAPDELKKTMRQMQALQQFIKSNEFDFVLLQDTNANCDTFFQNLTQNIYAIAGQRGDATLFYNTQHWQIPNSESGVKKLTPNINRLTADVTQKHQVVYSVFQFKGHSNLQFGLGTMRLCRAHQENGISSRCERLYTEAHQDDFNELISIFKEQNQNNWVLAGDMGVENKTEFLTAGIREEMKANNISNLEGLNEQMYDMAFYSGEHIHNMRYTSTPIDPKLFPNHNGFTLHFTLGY